MIRRLKTTIFLTCKETSSALELKKMVAGIIKKAVTDIKLFNKEDKELEEEKSLSDFGLVHSCCRPYCPGELLLVLRGETREEVQVAPYSNPPDLPDVMKQDPPDEAMRRDMPEA